MTPKEQCNEILKTFNLNGESLEEYMGVSYEQANKLHHIAVNIDVTKNILEQFDKILHSAETPNELMYLTHALGSYVVLKLHSR